MLPESWQIKYKSGTPKYESIFKSKNSISEEVINLFSSNKICPITVSPYQSLNFWSGVGKFANGRINLDNTLMAEIVEHTPRHGPHSFLH